MNRMKGDTTMKPEYDPENPTPIDLLLQGHNEYDAMVGEQRDRSLEAACNELIDAIRSVQDWNETYVGDCIEKLESFFVPNAGHESRQ